jgi:hypothetical protein
VTVDSHIINMAYGGMRPGAGGVLITPAKPPSAPVGNWEPVTPQDADFVAIHEPGLTSAPSQSSGEVKQTWGTLPLLADMIRDITDRWNEDNPGRPLVPLQMQAIMWTWWKRQHPPQQGKEAVAASEKATWEAYGDEWVPSNQRAKIRLEARRAREAA